MVKITAKIEKGDAPSDCKIIIGGNSKNPSWEEYLSDYKEPWQPYITAIKEVIISNRLLGQTGEQFCNYNYFSFSDGKSIAFTWRGWGDLMQAIVNKREGYMTYYM